MIGVGTTIFLVNPATFPSTSYLLDTYSASAAYSLRQLKTGVTNVVRVRRSSDNAEQDFTATDITDGTLTTWTGANDGFVVTWYDQAGSFDLVKATASAQPKIVTAGVVNTKGGKPCVFFDGVDDEVLYTSSGVLNTTNISLFSVLSANTAGTSNWFLTTGTTTTDAIRINCDARTTPNRHLLVANGTNYFADLSTARNDINQRLLSSFIDGSKNMSAFDNGSTGGTSTYAGSVSSTRLVVGNGGAVAAVRLQELILFNTDESANRTTIEADINDYYSIY